MIAASKPTALSAFRRNAGSSSKMDCVTMSVLASGSPRMQLASSSCVVRSCLMSSSNSISGCTLSPVVRRANER